MAKTEENEALGDLEIGRRKTPAANMPAPPNVLEQARLGNLDLFRTELESGNHPLDFKAGHAVYFNRTPLHMAALEGHDEIVEFMLSRPEISREVVNAKDCFGYTPLHLAVRHSHLKVVKLLTTSSWVLPDRFLAATSEPDDVGEHYGGCTPLHLAAVSGHIAIARLLVRQPCQVESEYDLVNIRAMTWNNSTPLDLARENKFRELLDFLEASDSNWLQQERAMTATSANAVLVGAALVAAAAFSAWLQPPGIMPSPDSGAPSASPSTSSLSARSYRNNNMNFHVCVTYAFSFSMVSLVLGIWATFSNIKGSSKVNLRLLRGCLDTARSCLLAALVFLIFSIEVASNFVFAKVVIRLSAIGIPFLSAGFIFTCFWFFY